MWRNHFAPRPATEFLCSSPGPSCGMMAKIRGIVCLASDITKRKQIENALRESEAKYRRLHESMRDAFVSVGMNGRILESNQAYRALLGYSEEELRQLTYLDLTPEQWHTREAKIVQEQVLPRGYSEVYEKEYRHKDRTVLPVESAAFPCSR